MVQDGFVAPNGVSVQRRLLVVRPTYNAVFNPDTVARSSKHCTTTVTLNCASVRATDTAHAHSPRLQLPVPC